MKLLPAIPVLITLFLFSCGPVNEDPVQPELILLREAVSLEELLKWEMVGIGEKSHDEQEDVLKLTEGKYSKGLVLLSPIHFGENVTLRFQIKPLQREGICVVILSASDMKTGGEVKVPKGYDGNFDFWTADEATVRNYVFAFHTGYHQPFAFIRKNPGFEELAKKKDTVTKEKWYDIEVGRRGILLWLKIDGKTLLEVLDQEPRGLPAGQFGFRLRGSGDGSFSVLFKEVVVETLTPP